MNSATGARRPLVTWSTCWRKTPVAVRVGVPDRDRRGRHRPPASGKGHKGDPGLRKDGLVAHSLATALVAAGMPAVIG
jgi:hypothetical protein